MRTAQDIDVLRDSTGRDLHVDRARTGGLRIALAAAAVVALVDQLSKAWAVDRLSSGPCGATADACIDLFWTARFHLHYNTGAAFSTGESLGRAFGVVAFVMSAVLLNMASKRVDRFGPVLLGTITGGAVGNLIDRVARAEDGLLSGAVVDFIDFQWWPIFNVADAAVVGGVIIFALFSMVRPESGTPGSAESDEADTGSADETEDEAEPEGRSDRGADNRDEASGV